MFDEINSRIKKSIPDATVYVVNPRQDNKHFEAIVISASFDSLSLVKQHQVVMNSVKDIMEKDRLHALALKTFTPAKWDANKSQYSGLI